MSTNAAVSKGEDMISRLMIIILAATTVICARTCGLFYGYPPLPPPSSAPIVHATSADFRSDHYLIPIISDTLVTRFSQAYNGYIIIDTVKGAIKITISGLGNTSYNANDTLLKVKSPDFAISHDIGKREVHMQFAVKDADKGLRVAKVPTDVLYALVHKLEAQHGEGN